jgi:hypothetical protein
MVNRPVTTTGSVDAINNVAEAGVNQLNNAVSSMRELPKKIIPIFDPAMIQQMKEEMLMSEKIKKEEAKSKVKVFLRR